MFVACVCSLFQVIKQISTDMSTKNVTGKIVILHKALFRSKFGVRVGVFVVVDITCLHAFVPGGRAGHSLCVSFIHLIMLCYVIGSSPTDT